MFLASHLSKEDSKKSSQQIPMLVLKNTGKGQFHNISWNYLRRKYKLV